MAPATGVPAATTNQSWIVIQGRQFFPKEATLSPGSTVVFYNADSEPQRVRSQDGSLDTGILAAGKASAPITVTGTGTINLSSTTHPEMAGVLNVR
jgi:plastocyanin